MKITMRWKGHRHRQVWVEGGDIKLIIKRWTVGSKREPEFTRVSVQIRCDRMPSGGTVYAGPSVGWVFRSARRDISRLLGNTYAGVA